MCTTLFGISDNNELPRSKLRGAGNANKFAPTHNFAARCGGVVVQGCTVDEAMPAPYSDTGDAIKPGEIKISGIAYAEKLSI